MPGNGPWPGGRHSIACRVADPLRTTTVSGPPDVWPQAVATVSVRTSGTRTNAYSFVIWQSPITGYHGCRRLCRNPAMTSDKPDPRTLRGVLIHANRVIDRDQGSLGRNSSFCLPWIRRGL